MKKSARDGFPGSFCKIFESATRKQEFVFRAFLFKDDVFRPFLFQYLWPFRNFVFFDVLSVVLIDFSSRTMRMIPRRIEVRNRWVEPVMETGIVREIPQLTVLWTLVYQPVPPRTLIWTRLRSLVALVMDLMELGEMSK